MSAYLDRVRAILATMPHGVGLTAYDTGFGLSICPEMGREAPTIFVARERVAYIPVPPSGPNWDSEWDEAKALVRAALAGKAI